MGRKPWKDLDASEKGPELKTKRSLSKRLFASLFDFTERPVTADERLQLGGAGQQDAKPSHLSLVEVNQAIKAWSF